jgi:CRP-like cAMP-binding protein
MSPRAKDLVLSDLERRLALRTIVGFEALGDDALVALSSLGRRREYAAGETIHSPNHAIDHGGEHATLPLILQGNFELVRDGERWRGVNAKRLLELSWLARDTMPFTLETTDGAIVLELPLSALEEALEEHFPSWLATTRALAGWLVDARHTQPAPLERHTLHRKPGLVERIAALEEALPFARGYVDALLQLAEEATEVRFDRGAVIWRRGEAAHSLLVPLDGSLRGSNDGEEPLGLGGLELLAGRNRTTQLEATQPLSALRLAEETLLDMLEDHHALARDLTAMLAAAVIPLLPSPSTQPQAPAPPPRAEDEP